MKKVVETKQRKRIRITMCVLYLLQILMCTFPFVMLGNGEKFKDESVFSMIYKPLFGGGDIDRVGGFVTFLPYVLLVILPVIGFFLCALDRERNIKNVCALLISLIGVMLILSAVPGYAILFGAVVQILTYIILTFMATAAMLSRLNKEPDPIPEKEMNKLKK